MPMQSTSQTRGIVVLVVVLIALATCGFLLLKAKHDSFTALQQRTLTIGRDITIRTAFGDPLAVIAETVASDGTVTPMAYAMIGASGGALTIGDNRPEGSILRLHFGLNADIVGIDAAGKPQSLEPHTLRGLSGADYSGQSLALEGAQITATFDHRQGKVSLVVDRAPDRLVIMDAGAK